MPSNFLPSISQLISEEDMPAELGFLGSSLQVFFENTFYKNYRHFTSKYGEFASISADIVLHQPLQLTLPGTGIDVSLNYQSGTTVIPISFSYDWRVLKFKNTFSIESFLENPQSLYRLLMDITGIQPSHVLQQSILSFYSSSDPIAEWISNYNAAHSSSPLSVAPDANTDVYFNNLLNALNGSDTNIEDIVYNQDISSDSISSSVQKTESLFQKWLGNFNIENFSELILPKFKLSVDNLSVSLVFPRNILTPVNNDPTSSDYLTPLPEPARSSLSFNVGSVSYSSSAGFELSMSSSLSLSKARLLNTPLVVSFDRLKLDLSRTKNIAEADADSRPSDFIGLYILEGSIEFPNFFNHDQTNSSAKIAVRNLLVGTGGISGFVVLEPSVWPVSPGDPLPEAMFKLGNKNDDKSHFLLALTDFQIQFKQNAIVQSEISGYLKIPGFHHDTGADARIDVRVHIGNNGDFRITATEADHPYTVGVKDVFMLALRSVGIGRERDKWYIEAAGSLTITAEIPHVTSDFLKQPIDIKRLRIY